MIVIVMGVSGAGKTTIGEALAKEMGWRFLDSDDYHPPGNVAKMAAGQPLDDEDRWPWLEKISSILRSEKDAVLACSALKEDYRKRLSQAIKRVAWVYLYGDFELIQSRMAQRRHRYMPAALLRSQFETLEPPTGAIAVNIAADVPACVAAIAVRLRGY